MAAEDMDRQDRLEGLARGKRRADELARLDPRDLFHQVNLDVVLGVRAFHAGGIDLITILNAAEEHRNETLHTMARMAAAATIRGMDAHEDPSRYQRLVDRPFPQVN